MPSNVFVLGLDELNLAALQNLPHFAQYRFRPLLSIDELLYAEEINLTELLDKAHRQLASFEGSVDAVIGYWDFPVSLMLPILCRWFGLRGPSLESVVKCEHKYWSRLEQQKVIDDYPQFALVDLNHPVIPPLGLNYPLSLKPVKSFASEFAFHVAGPAEFREAVTAIAEGIDRVAKPFELVLARLELPPKVAQVGVGHACLAEEALRGVQATVEGYSLNGHVHVYGVVDSICYPNSSSFLRYQYPSKLPGKVTDRMIDVTGRVIRQIGLDNWPFNLEFFWDAGQDSINLLEVNSRHSQSHAILFADVDGVPNHECMVSLAFGRDPSLPYRQGPYNIAAKWFLRRFTDGVVRRSPTPREVTRTERETPGTTLKIVAHRGDRLSKLRRQDSYSYELADIYVGAADETELIAKYERCAEALLFEFDE